MRITVLFVLILTLLLSCSCPSPRFIQIAVDDSEQVRELSKSVVQVRTQIEEEKTIAGSGVVIDTGKTKTLILTVSHILDPLLLSKVESKDGTICEARPLIIDHKNDLAFLVSRCISGIPAIVAEKDPEIGVQCSIIGNPLGFKTTNGFITTDGRYSGRDEEEDNVFSIPATTGNSGSPIFCNGKLTGIVDSVGAKYDHMTFSNNMEEIHAFLNLLKSEPDAGQ